MRHLGTCTPKTITHPRVDLQGNADSDTPPNTASVPNLGLPDGLQATQRPIRFASVCSGIEAASAAWHPLGWQCQFVSEIEPFPCSVLKHHYPTVPNYGDMTKHHEWPTTNLDVLIGGTPCQAFSVAGLRQGLADPRGNLTLTFLSIIGQYRPRWVVWENVPGVLSDKTGAFGAFLGGLAELGYGFAYRILDAQYFGVAQRRRRVFVVAHAGGQWQRAAAVLFERESLSGDTAPRREPGKRIAGTVRGGTESGSNEPHDKIEVRLTAPTLSARTKGGGGLDTDFDLDGGVIPIQEIGKRQSGNAMNGVGHGAPGDPMYTLQSAAVHGICEPIAFPSEMSTTQRVAESPVSQALKTGPMAVAQPIGIDGGEIGFALRATASHSGDKGDGGINTTMVAEVAPTMRAGGNKTGGDRPYGTDVDTCDSLVPEVLAHGQGNAEHVSDGEPSLTCNHEAPIMFEPRYYTRENKTGGQPSDTAVIKADASKRGDSSPHVCSQMAVRRLTPRECERLQGFPDDYTLVLHNKKPAADGPRYKALGNSMARPVIEWLGKRIEFVESLK